MSAADRTPEDSALGDRELDVMAVIWESGSGTVAEVREQLPVDLAYTTVLTILRNLEGKGFLSREEEGRGHRYFPAVARHTAQRNALSRLIDKLFHGSPEQLMAQLVEDRALSAAELQRISRRLTAGEKRDARARSGKRRSS